jgi:predicted phage tail protein
MTVRTIKLHGFMGQKYTKTIKLDGENLFQIMSGLASRFGPKFKEDIRSNNWHIVEGRVKDKRDIGTEELDKKLTSPVLHLIPAVAGASGALRVVLGVVMMVVGYYYGQAWLIQLGAGMALGGVAEMLTKPVTAGPTQTQAGGVGSLIYNGAVNVSSQGGAIPLIYGRVQRASSVIISADFSSDDFS